ncbi:MAG: ribbon-helix-helix domain-containing protein [Verrucomicrobiota bacterium]
MGRKARFNNPKRFSLSLESEMLERLDSLAQEYRLERNQLIERLLKRALDELGNEDPFELTSSESQELLTKLSGRTSSANAKNLSALNGMESDSLPGKSTPYAPYIRPGESSEEFSERFRNENTPEEAALIWSVPVERAAKLLKYKVIPDDVFLSIEQIMEEQQCNAETAMKFFLNYRAFKSKKKKSASAALSKALAK